MLQGLEITGDRFELISQLLASKTVRDVLPKTNGLLPRDLFSIFAAGLAGVFRLLVLSLSAVQVAGEMESPPQSKNGFHRPGNARKYNRVSRAKESRTKRRFPFSFIRDLWTIFQDFRSFLSSLRSVLYPCIVQHVSLLQTRKRILLGDYFFPR